MHNGDTFAMEVVRERYLRPGTEREPGVARGRRAVGALQGPRLLRCEHRKRCEGISPPALWRGPRRSDHDRDGGGCDRDNFKKTRPARETAASRTTLAKDVTKDSSKGKAEAPTFRRTRPSDGVPRRAGPRQLRFEDTYAYMGVPFKRRFTRVAGTRGTPSAPLPHSAFWRVRRTMKTPTYFTADAEAKAPWRSELMRGSIEALYGTDDLGAKACTEATYVRYLAWIAERGTVGAGSPQPYLSAINTFLRHTGRDDAPAISPTIIDM
eukprot:jgi/Tetstr1/438338/TSEL_026905.t1